MIMISKKEVRILSEIVDSHSHPINKTDKDYLDEFINQEVTPPEITHGYVQMDVDQHDRKKDRKMIGIVGSAGSALVGKVAELQKEWGDNVEIVTGETQEEVLSKMKDESWDLNEISEMEVASTEKNVMISSRRLSSIAGLMSAMDLTNSNGSYDGGMTRQQISILRNTPIDVPKGYQLLEKKVQIFIVNGYKIAGVNKKTAQKKYTHLMKKGDELMKRGIWLFGTYDQFQNWYRMIYHKMILSEQIDLESHIPELEKEITRVEQGYAI